MSIVEIQNADFSVNLKSIGLLIARRPLPGAHARADGTIHKGDLIVSFDGRTGALEIGIHGV